MKTLHFILFFLLTRQFFSQGDSLIRVGEFGENPGNLKMYLHNPFNNRDTIRRPVVIVLHGCSQDAKAVADLTGWNKIASNEKFYVIYPEQKVINNPSMCFNWFLKDDIEKGKGENASIYSMITWMKKFFAIDTSRIYITGLSAGAAMTVVMLSDYPSIFNAGAEFAGGPYKSATTIPSSFKALTGKLHKTPQEWSALVKEQNLNYKLSYPKLIVWHGGKDHVVNKRNATELIAQWCGVYGIDTIADKRISDYKNANGLMRTEFSDSLNTTKIIYYSMKDMGHELPIQPGPKKNQGGKKGLFSTEKNFHSTWLTALDFGLVKEE
jgi:poly(hydroxyalkanoate) depolymerase family esterase